MRWYDEDLLIPLSSLQTAIYSACTITASTVALGLSDEVQGDKQLGLIMFTVIGVAPWSF